VRRPLQITVVATLAALALTACGAAPEPDPEEFWTQLSFYTDLPDDYRAQAVDEGMSACDELTAASAEDGDGADVLAASWASWVDQMGTKDAGFFWRTAVEHLCPGEAKTLEEVQASYDAAS
jgi:hypothetical protein